MTSILAINHFKGNLMEYDKESMLVTGKLPKSSHREFPHARAERLNTSTTVKPPYCRCYRGTASLLVSLQTVRCPLLKNPTKRGHIVKTAALPQPKMDYE